MNECKHDKPKGKASGYVYKNKWTWQKPSWIKCSCGLWHSNRHIPRSFWNQEWKLKPAHERKKVGVILVRNKTEFWITQSYNNCYGFPKGEKEYDETIEECAKREFKEETGCSIDSIVLSKQIAITTYLGNIQYIFYIIHVPSDFDLSTFPVDDVEITSCGWRSINNMHMLKLSKASKRIFELYKRYLWIINKI